MRKQEVEDRIISVVCSVLDVDRDMVLPESHFVFDLGAESTQSVELVAALEDPDARVRLWAVTAISRTTALRFDYDARVTPEKQRDNIRIIKETLRLRTSFK